MEISSPVTAWLCHLGDGRGRSGSEIGNEIPGETGQTERDGSNFGALMRPGLKLRKVEKDRTARERGLQRGEENEEWAESQEG